MITNILPSVWIGGQPAAVRAADLATGPVVMDGLSVDWGREEYLSHSKTATATVSLLDKTGQIGAQAAAGNLVGQNLVVEVGNMAGWGFWMFQGRITSCIATIEDYNFGTEGTRLWRIELAAADKTADLGQIIQPPVTWPEQTMLDRALAIRNSSIIAGISEYYFYPGSVDLYAWPMDVKDKDNLGLMKDFYFSMGDTYSYLPDENVVRYLHRRSYDASAYLVRTDDDVIVIETAPRTYDERVYPGFGLLACDLTPDNGTNFMPNSVLTRVEASFHDYTQGFADAVIASNTAETLATGRRTLTFETWLNHPDFVTDVVTEVLARGTTEGSVPRHPRVVWDQKVAGGFYSLAQAQNMLLAAETQAIGYLSGSAHNQFVRDWPPFFAILGGTIEWVDTRWLITMNLQRHNATNKQTRPPVISPLIDRTKFDPSITDDDLRWLADGNLHQPNASVLP